MLSLIAETKSCSLLRCSSALPLCFPRTIQCFCASSLSVRNPCSNKLSLYTEPSLGCFASSLPGFSMQLLRPSPFFFQMFVANPFCQHRILLMHDVYLLFAPPSKNRVLLCYQNSYCRRNPLVCVASSGLTLVPSCSYACLSQFFLQVPVVNSYCRHGILCCVVLSSALVLVVFKKNSDSLC